MSFLSLFINTHFWFNHGLFYSAVFFFCIFFLISLFFELNSFSSLIKTLHWFFVVYFLTFLFFSFDFIAISSIYDNVINADAMYEKVCDWWYIIEQYTENQSYLYYFSILVSDLDNDFKNNYYMENINLDINVLNDFIIWFFLHIDNFVYFYYFILFFFIAIIFIGFCDQFFMDENKRIEFSTLIFLIFLASVFLLASTDFIEIFLALECISLSAFVLVSFEKKKKLSAVSGIRYLIISTIPASLFVLGLAFFYKDFGIFFKNNLEIILNSFFNYNNTLNDFLENISSSISNDFTLLDITKRDPLESNYLDYLFDTTTNKNELFYDRNIFILTALNNIPIELSPYLRVDYQDIITDLDNNEIIIKKEKDIFEAGGPFMDPEHFKSPSGYWEKIENERLFNDQGEFLWIPIHEAQKTIWIPVNNSFNFNNPIYNVFLEYGLDLEISSLINQINKLNNSNSFYQNFSLFNWNLENWNILTYHDSLLIGIQIGLFFILINFLFKITGAPFHTWAPAIYNNAPTSVVIFLSIFVKIVMFCFFLSIFASSLYNLKYIWGLILLISSILSIVLGMIGAFNEKFIKRFIIYSSVGHVGFMLISLPFFLLEGNKYMIDYLIIYSISSIILWFIVMLSRKNIKFLTNLKIILANNFFLNLVFAINIFSMAGIPPLAGFFIKFDVLYYVLYSSNFYLTFFILLITVINFFYYLRLIKIVYFESINWTNIKIKFNRPKLYMISLLIHLILFFFIFVDSSFIYLLENSLYVLY